MSRTGGIFALTIILFQHLQTFPDNSRLKTKVRWIGKCRARRGLAASWGRWRTCGLGRTQGSSGPASRLTSQVGKVFQNHHERQMSKVFQNQRYHIAVMIVKYLIPQSRKLLRLSDQYKVLRRQRHWNQTHANTKKSFMSLWYWI